MASREEQDISDFATRAGQPTPGLIRELWDFLRENKKWWLLPVIAILLVVGGLILLGSTAMAPYIYTLF